MQDKMSVLERDLCVLEEMIAELESYLMSEATHWNMKRADMPKLSIGGCLMRLHRLQVLKGELDGAQRERLTVAKIKFSRITADKVVRFEARAHQELRARLRQWSRYLADMRSERIADRTYYATVVDTRLVIDMLVRALQAPPYQLQPEILPELNEFDRHLDGRWQPGAFVLDAVWQLAYPAERYWWLYGQPKKVATAVV